MAVTQRCPLPGQKWPCKISRRQPSRRGTSAPLALCDGRISRTVLPPFGDCACPKLQIEPCRCSLSLPKCKVRGGSKRSTIRRESLISLYLDLSRRSSPKQGQYKGRVHRVERPWHCLDKTPPTPNSRSPTRQCTNGCHVKVDRSLDPKGLGNQCDCLLKHALGHATHKRHHPTAWSPSHQPPRRHGVSALRGIVFFPQACSLFQHWQSPS